MVFLNNDIDNYIFKYVLKISNKLYSQINYGKFNIKNPTNLIGLIKTISQKSNYDYKITIINGWEKYNLKKYLLTFYDEPIHIDYENLICDTYVINSSNSFDDLKKFLILKKNNFFIKHKNNQLFDKYSIKEILIISSLVEKEGFDIEDKRLITSVIFNRLNIGMKLQIDATVIYSKTEGLYKLNSKLNYSDLKIKHPYNTYFIAGLPQGMISYVSAETLKIVLENPKSDFLFYFYNIIEKKHIFSKNYNEHKKKLNEYRKKK